MKPQKDDSIKELRFRGVCLVLLVLPILATQLIRLYGFYNGLSVTFGEVFLWFAFGVSLIFAITLEFLRLRRKAKERDPYGINPRKLSMRELRLKRNIYLSTGACLFAAALISLWRVWKLAELDKNSIRMFADYDFGIFIGLFLIGLIPFRIAGKTWEELRERKKLDPVGLEEA
jgi:hypothetical protein